jgi:hypothetical protein
MILRGRIVALATPSTSIYIHHTYINITLTSHLYRHSAERAPHRIDDGHGLLL